jgi:5-formyltetrahydrofolate cyclo-ligase
MLRPPVIVVGLAFGKQVGSALPRADWDESVDLIITEHEMLRCEPRRREARPASVD